MRKLILVLLLVFLPLTARAEMFFLNHGGPNWSAFTNQIIFGDLGTATKAIDFENSGLSGDTDYPIYIDADNYWAASGRMSIAEADMAIITDGAYLNVSIYRDGASSGGMLFRRARGTKASPSTISQDDSIYFYFKGYDDDFGGNMAAIQVAADGECNTSGDTSDTPGRIVFWTTPDGSHGIVERMVIKNDGKVGIGADSPASVLSVEGNINIGNAIENGNLAGGLIIENGTSASAAVTDGIQIFASDSTDSTSSLSLYLEQAVEAVGTFTASHKLKIEINGTWYWIELDAV